MRYYCQGKCGTKLDKAGKCRECKRIAEALRIRPDRQSAAERGYADPEYLRNKKTTLTEYPYCMKCGHAGSEDNPLQVDHIVPRHVKVDHSLANLQTLCRDCNLKKGGKY